MKETNYSKIETIFKNNGGFITRKDIDNTNIPSWFLSDFVSKNHLNKIAPGFYSNDEYTVDNYYVLQKRYPQYIFMGMSALYLLGLTDKTPDAIEVCAPKNYHPSRSKIESLVVHKISSKDIYELGIRETETMFGNAVLTYDEERTICDLIRHRERYDSETFVKAIRLYTKKINNHIKLFNYAKKLGIEKKVYEIIEIMANEN